MSLKYYEPQIVTPLQLNLDFLQESVSLKYYEPQNFTPLQLKLIFLRGCVRRGASHRPRRRLPGHEDTPLHLHPTLPYI